MISTQMQINSREFELAMVRAASALHRDYADVVREETGRLMQNLITVRTPPKTRSQGLKRVRGDILNVVTPVDERFLDVLERAFGKDGYVGEYKAKGRKRVRIGYSEIIRDFDRLKFLHKTLRNRRTGRTRKNRTRSLNTPDKAFVPKSLFNRYVRYQQKGLGMAKGGWWAAARHVYQRRAPAGWVTRKAGQGTAVVDLRPGPRQTFIAVNRSPWANNRQVAEQAVRDAMRYRARTIPKALDQALRRRYSAAGFIVRGVSAFA